MEDKNISQTEPIDNNVSQPAAEVNQQSAPNPIQPSLSAQPVWTPDLPQSEKPESPLQEDLKGSPGPLSPRNIVKLFVGIFAIFIVAFILFIFIVPNLNKSSENTTISYWGVLEDPKAMEPIINDFEKFNPNITVNYQKLDVKDYREKLTTRISQGTGPDIFSFHNTWYPMLSSILLPLPTDIISKEQFNKSYYPVMGQDLIQKGGIYGIPDDVDVLSLYINKDLLKQAGISVPKTWNDFINAARSLTVKDQAGKIQTAGAALGTFDNITNAPDIISLLFVQDGVNLNDLSASKDRVSDALRFYTAFAQGDGSVWNATLDPSILAFSKGNLAMYLGFARDFPTIKSSSQNLNFEIDPIPQLTFQSQSIASYWATGVSANKNQKASLTFMKYLAQKDVQNKLYQEELSLNPNTFPSALVDLGGRLQNTSFATIISDAKNSTSSYFAGETFDNGLNTQANNYLSSAVSSILAGTTPDSAADALIAGVSQVLNQYPKK